MQGITNPICKESAFNAADSGKIDYFKPPDLDSKSTACGFFTDDSVGRRSGKFVGVAPRIHFCFAFSIPPAIAIGTPVGNLAI